MRAKVEECIMQVQDGVGKKQREVIELMKPLSTRLFDQVLMEEPFNVPAIDYEDYRIEEWDDEEGSKFIEMIKVMDNSVAGIELWVNCKGNIGIASIKGGISHGFSVQVISN